MRNDDGLNACPNLSMPVQFINDYERHGRYTGFPSLGIEWQKMESPVLRQALGMQASGVFSCRACQGRQPFARPNAARAGGPLLCDAVMLNVLLLCHAHLQPGQRGVLIRRIEPTSPASQVLSKGDIVLRWVSRQDLAWVGVPTPMDRSPRVNTALLSIPCGRPGHSGDNCWHASATCRLRVQHHRHRLYLSVPMQL